MDTDEHGLLRTHIRGSVKWPRCCCVSLGKNSAAFKQTTEGTEFHRGTEREFPLCSSVFSVVYPPDSLVVDEATEKKTSNGFDSTEIFYGRKIRTE